ncbi:MAG TPA: hypothetical protein VGR54_04745 [Nitrosopumilaceae archaeon]|nr:hypothetical protein [Nitrosopumilaceae archaeon]
MQKNPSHEITFDTTLIVSLIVITLLSSFVFYPLVNHVFADTQNNIKIKEKTDSQNMKTKSQKTIVVAPLFTAAAYSHNGFYDYYRGECDTKCLTVSLNQAQNGSYVSSGNGVAILKSILGYSTITDADVDKNPRILQDFNRVILLHNEYVTKKEFDAITHHPNVIYLYPNALYAQVKVDYSKNTITLINGHAYPYKNIGNGFNWKYDNSKFEYDTKCDSWQFVEINNGKMLNCYPESRILNDTDLINTIKELKASN